MFTDSAIAYEANAQEFLRGRDTSLIGSQVVEQWSSTLSKGSQVIELGCGGGYRHLNNLRCAQLGGEGLSVLHRTVP